MESEAAEGRSATQSERPDRTFELDGERYELPLISTFNLDEERILYVYADVVIQDLIPIHPDADEAEKLILQSQQLRKFRNPDLKRAVAHVAYKRSHADASDEDIEKALGRVNALELDIAMFVDEDPTKTSQTSSENEKNENGHTAQSSSGRHTESTSPSPVLTLASTGTIASETHSPLSDQATPA